jgi:hypothetical protein
MVSIRSAPVHAQSGAPWQPVARRGVAVPPTTAANVSQSNSNSSCMSRSLRCFFFGKDLSGVIVNPTRCKLSSVPAWIWNLFLLMAVASAVRAYLVPHEGDKRSFSFWSFSFWGFITVFAVIRCMAAVLRDMVETSDEGRRRRAAANVDRGPGAHAQVVRAYDVEDDGNPTSPHEHQHPDHAIGHRWAGWCTDDTERWLAGVHAVALVHGQHADEGQQHPMAIVLVDDTDISSSDNDDVGGQEGFAAPGP